MKLKDYLLGLLATYRDGLALAGVSKDSVRIRFLDATLDLMLPRPTMLDKPTAKTLKRVLKENPWN